MRTRSIGKGTDRAIRDAVIIAVAVAVLLILAWVFDLYGFIKTWIDSHGSLPYGEILFMAVLCFSVLFLYFFRRKIELKRAFAESRERDEAYRKERDLSFAILDTVGALVVVMDSTGRIVLFNRACERLTGYRFKEVKDKSVWELFLLPEEVEPVMHVFGRLSAGDFPSTFENYWLTRGGDRRLIAWSNTAIVSEDKTVEYVIGTGIDVTDRRRMEEEIRHHTENLESLVEERAARIQELERQRGEMERLASTGRMAAGVAHEINNPLAGIKNAFLLVKEAVPEDHAYHMYVGLIEKEIERIRNIVLQMYQLYRPERHRPNLIDMPQLLKEIQLILDARIEKKALQIKRVIAPELPPIRQLEGNLRQVLYNLLVNAIQASFSGSEIEVAVGLSDDKLHISVTDHGEGISTENLPKIFEPFYTTKQGEDHSGLGLGLAVSHSLAAAMGGQITVETEMGKGSTFTLILPIEASIPESPPEKEFTERL
jgi:PAS domain S-box-containing protein